MKFKELTNLICEKSPLQKKRIQSFHSKQNKKFFDEAENFVIFYNNFLESKKLKFDFIADGYLNMCRDMMKSRIYFLKEGKYPSENQKEVFDNLYNKENEMLLLMIGLAFTQFLWETHYEMYQHFKNFIKKETKNNLEYLEIGPGHGLFLKYALDELDNKDNSFKVVDISPTSIEITKNIISQIKSSNKNLDFVIADIYDYNALNKFDLIVAGELIEHLDNPVKFLLKLKKLLKPDGKIFLTTCVNCPTNDHVVYFKNTETIKKMIKLCGLKILEEKILPVEKLSVKEIKEKKITINYSAIIQRA